MALLITGVVIFFAAHFYSAFRSRTAEKDIKAKIGEGPYMGLYSLVSGIGLGLMIYGYMTAAPTGNLYIGPEWARHALMTLMLLAFILLAAAYIPNTHIKKIVKHPMLSAVILWSAGHLMMGANQQKLLLFGSFLIFGIVDFLAASRRSDEGVRNTPNVMADLIAIFIGGGVFAATLFWAHEAIIGVSPIL